MEKPIEYIFTSRKSFIEQREIGRDITSARQGLSNLLDTDVDVVGLSDGDEPGVIDKIINLVGSHKLVLMICTAQSVIDTLRRLDSFIPISEREVMRARLGRMLSMMVVQRLLPRLGGGRILISEIYRQTHGTSGIISEGSFSGLETLMSTSKTEDMLTWDRALVAAVKKGEITAETALAETSQPEQLKKLF